MVLYPNFSSGAFNIIFARLVRVGYEKGTLARMDTVVIFLTVVLMVALFLQGHRWLYIEVRMSLLSAV